MLFRAAILVVGPVLLTATCYSLTVGRGDTRSAANAPISGSNFDVEALRDGVDAGLSTDADLDSDNRDSGRLAVLCDQRAKKLATLLDPTARLIVRVPFVLGGDLPEEVLDGQYRNTILPTARALSLVYFDREPDEPITILMYSSEKSYQDASWRLDRRDTVDYHGYYIRPDRRIVLNVSTGEGTVAHELTHALAHFDFPQIPEWFDEGLGSLYEESDFTDDGLQLVGFSNWRLNHLLHAMQNRRLKNLESLITSRDLRTADKSVQYAHARYFCFYLQDRGLLPFFYRRFRLNSASDPSGLRTLCDLFGTSNLDAIDRDYRRWVIALYEQLRTPN